MFIFNTVGNMTDVTNTTVEVTSGNFVKLNV